MKRGWKGRLAGDGFSYGELERGKWGQGQHGPLYASLAVKTVQYMDKKQAT